MVQRMYVMSCGTDDVIIVIHPRTQAANLRTVRSHLQWSMVSWGSPGGLIHLWWTVGEEMEVVLTLFK